MLSCLLREPRHVTDEHAHLLIHALEDVAAVGLVEHGLSAVHTGLGRGSRGARHSGGGARGSRTRSSRVRCRCGAGQIRRCARHDAVSHSRLSRGRAGGERGTTATAAEGSQSAPLHAPRHLLAPCPFSVLCFSPSLPTDLRMTRPATHRGGSCVAVGSVVHSQRTGAATEGGTAATTRIDTGWGWPAE